MDRERAPCVVTTRQFDDCRIDNGGTRAAAVYTLIGTAKLNGVDPEVSAFRADPHRRSSDPLEPLFILLLT